MQTDIHGRSLRISHYTSDGDSKACKGIEEGQNDSSVILLRDTQHLSVSMHRAVCNAKFSSSMFPKSTAAKRERAQRELGHDLRRRVQGEFQAAFKKYDGNIDSLINHFSYCTDALIECYSGSCGLNCQKYSLLCNGNKRKWNHNAYLKFLDNAHSASLQPNETDRKLLRSIVGIRLSPRAVNLQRFNTNSQKSEAINRTYSRTNPKGVTFARNFAGRIHSAVHLRNQGIGLSTIQKCQSLSAPITKHSKVERALAAEQTAEQQRANYHKTLKAKASRSSARLQKYKIYSAKKDRVTYQKNILDNFVSDHCYSTRQKVVKRVQFNEHSYSKKK